MLEKDKNEVKIPRKDLNEYTLEEFQQMELFGEEELFNDVIIVPMDDIHDSGYRCMKFILVRDGEIVGAVSGWSDVVHPNGIGNQGKNWDYKKYPTHIPWISLSMDCLVESGCVRLMMAGLYRCRDSFIGSDFIFYKEEKNGA